MIINIIRLLGKYIVSFKQKDPFPIFLTDYNGTTKLVTTNVTKFFQKVNTIFRDYYVPAK